MIKEAIVKIVDKQDLTYDEAYEVITEIMTGQTTPTQNAAFLAQGDITLEDYQEVADYSFGDMVRQILNIDNSTDADEDN